MKSSHPLLLATLAFCQFLIAVDHNIVLVTLPELGRSLSVTGSTLGWVVSAYALAFGGLLLLGGRLADLFGRRRVMIAGLVAFGIGSVLAAVAPSIELVLTGRALQGVGGALLAPAVLATIAVSFPEGPQRFRALSVWSAAGAVGLASGSAIGGVALDAWGWRAVFVINVALVAVALLGVLLAAPRSTRVSSGRTLDIPGVLLSALGVTAVVLSLSNGAEAGWGRWDVILSGLGGIGLLAAFVLRERAAASPLLPLSLLRHRSMSGGLASMLLFIAPIAAVYFVFSVFLQDVLGASPLATGLAFLPWGLTGLVGSVLAKTLLDRAGVHRAVPLGLAIAAVGTAGFAASVRPDVPLIVPIAWTMLLAIGQAIGFASLFAAAGSGVPAALQGVASATMSTAQQVGTALGLAVFVGIAVALGGTEPTVASTAAGLSAATWTGAGVLLVGAVMAAITLRPRPALAAERDLADAAAR